MFNKKILLILTGIIVAVALALIIFTPKVAIEERMQAAAAGLVLRGFTDDGMPYWTIVAQRGILDGEDWELFTIEFIFYYEERQRLIATAPSLYLLRGGDRAQLHGGVVIERDDGYRLFTPMLKWCTDDNIISAEQIEITSDDFDLTAKGFTYNLDQDRFHADGGFTILLDGFSIVGDVITETETGLIVMDRVSATGDDHKIITPQLFFYPGTREITAEGGVILSFDSGSIRANSLRYMLDDGAFTVEGKVQVTLHHDFFLGER
ncbi:LPS export ABC transporter periplasmic protein LptC [Candidatus Acetothermia bacterium]|jgi:hypothetical protein|nr:LPS export ABC transporter periplasmic protein LptC [Candidatus Acetothermia bacterium]MCI2427662.1 LPS export ABC transporter periplasmic protein LptC [Candidatus Acetothermia bacterium]MCI2428820.1 LPS export ABC transporter periplasmic protein LptC [Candidatus Acetothermia bacterium]